jgi:hypothetical protein
MEKIKMKSIALTLALLGVFAVAANAADKPVDPKAVTPAAAEEVASTDEKPADEAKKN